MGTTAINFHYESKIVKLNELETFLLQTMQAKRVSDTFEGYLNFILKSNDTLLELMIGKNCHLYIRAALCNPASFILALQELVEKLFSEFGGSFMNEHSKKIFKIWNQNLIEDVNFTYNERRKKFIEYYGDFFAPISCNEVVD